MIALICPCAGSLAVRTAQDLRHCELHMLQLEPFMRGEMIGGAQESQLTLGVLEAQRLNAKHLAVVEHDMRFPVDAFLRLRAHGKMIVGANYRQRNKRSWTTITDKPIHSYGKTGLEEVTTVGLGVTLIDMRVFDKLPQPWWFKPWVPEAQRCASVDVYFGRHAKKHGFSSWVDHDLSQDVAHISGGIELWVNKLVFTETGDELCGIPKGFDVD